MSKIFEKQNLYILSSFITGFSVMTVELISSRIVAPIIGSSVFTWTSVIGITVAGLATGSYAGGKIADKIEEGKPLPLSFLASSLLVSLIPLLSEKTGFLLDLSGSILYLNLFLSIYLFLLPTFAIGLIQPLILKKFVDDFSKIGSKYGLLSLAWSFGSVLGVFLTGFFFISIFGSKETVWLMSIMLFVTGCFFIKKDKKVRNFFIVAFVILFIIILIGDQSRIWSKSIIFEKETNYYNARVLDIISPEYGHAKILNLDFDFHGIDTDKEIVHYSNIYPIFSYVKKNLNNILVIGAGAYTLPKHLKEYYKGSEVSVIELDPEMIKIGNDYFDLEKYDIETLVGDAKIVMARNQKKYDLIFGDAYNSFISVPWYLLTKEWNEKIKGDLVENGIYAVNFIGSVSGENSEFTKSVLSTFRLSFPNYYIFALGNKAEDAQNIVLVGIKGERPLTDEDLWEKLSSDKITFLSQKLIHKKTFMENSSIILTDNFAPVERLMKPIMKSYFPTDLLTFKTILSL